MTLRNTSSEPLNVYFTGDPSLCFDVGGDRLEGASASTSSRGRWSYPKASSPTRRIWRAAKVTSRRTAPRSLADVGRGEDEVGPGAKTWDGRVALSAGQSRWGKEVLARVITPPSLGDVEVPKVTIRGEAKVSRNGEPRLASPAPLQK